MSYKSNIFKSGEKLYASQLNDMTNGIDEIYEVLGYETNELVDESKATPITFTFSAGYYPSEFNTGHEYGVIADATISRFVHSSAFEVKAGQTVVIYACFNKNIAGLLQVDSSGKPIGNKSLITGESTDYVTKTWTYKAVEDMYCVACNRCDMLPNSAWTIKIVNASEIVGIEKTLLPIETTVRNIVGNTSNVIKPNELRKAVICFTFDDGLSTDDTVYSIFKQKELVCNFAIPTTASARYNKYLQYQNDGFEILSHSTDSASMSDNNVAVSTIEDKFKNSKSSLEKAGFNINAWVTPSSQMHDDYIPALRKYYDLGFTVYLGDWDEIANGSQIPYNTFTDDLHKLWRVSMESTSIDRVKLAIDEAVDNVGYLNFYAHDFSRGLTQDNLKNILDYVKTYVDAGQCIVTTVTNGYAHYYTLRHNDLINLLTSNA